MPTTIYRMLAGSANEGCDVPATLTRRFKDLSPGTMALLTLLRTNKGDAGMIHVAWRTMAHDQPADVMTIDDAEHHFRLT